MKKSILIALSLIVYFNFFAQTNIYVSNNGPIYTLKDAYDLISNPGNVTYNIILKNDGGDIRIVPTNLNKPGIVWTKRGSLQHPINIYSENCYSVLTRDYDADGAMIELKNTQYINISGVHFYKGVKGSIMINGSNYCKIDFCKFSGQPDNPIDHINGGVIWIGGKCQDSISSQNIISNNKFYHMNTKQNTNHHQCIYVSKYAYNNSYFNNSIIESPATAISYGEHGRYNNNIAEQNICILQKRFSPPMVQTLFMGFYQHFDSTCMVNSTLSAIFNNTFKNNYVHDDYYTNFVNISAVSSGLNNNELGNVRYNSMYPHDPYWLGYSASNITNRMVSGDFDGDGKKDDIAAFYDNGVGSTNIHVWKTDDGSKAFVYDNESAGWWGVASGYNANKITGRVVSGDFNNDGKTDIAAFYDNGGGSTDLHVWTSTGTGFIYSGSNGWWGVASGYNSNKITGRVVSGDFNNDGKTDIAAFYDNGGGNTDLHVWLSNGNSFTYSNGSAGWWRVQSGYNVNKITGRVVSGYFNNDAYSDIAAFYDNGGGNTDLHVWLSNGDSFTYSNGSTGWWGLPKGYDVNKITGRVVSGDFDRNGYANDIAGFFDHSQACGSLRTNVWKKSTNNSFDHVNSTFGYPWLSSFQFSSLKSTSNSLDLENKPIIKTSLLNVYPNPTSNQITIENNNTNKKSVLKIVNLNEQEVISQTILESKTIIDISKLTPGIYFVKLINDNNLDVVRILKE